MYIGKIKPFQKEGADFCLNNKQALVAYEMGLGKTHITMYAIEHTFGYPALILCPNYLKWKWADEVETWTDSTYVIIDGIPKNREAAYSNYYDNPSNYMFVNYELLLRDYKILEHFNFKVIVCDEITRIKGYTSKTKKALKKLHTPEYKWGLTGTPVSNRPDELFSIMDWIDPKLFGKWWGFEKRYIVRGVFNQVESYVNLQELAQRSSARMITKKQEDVSDQLPEVVVNDVLVQPTKKQWSLYVEVASSLKNYLDVLVTKLVDEEDDSDFVTAMIRQRFSALRQACVCPKILEDRSSKYLQNLDLIFDDLGGKIPVTLDLIEEASGKVVVFSFYRGVVDILSDSLTKKGIPHLIIKGGMGAENVYEKVKEFQTGNYKVLLTTEAGDKGIDLQCAKYLINMDLPFSWEKYDQRIGRIKRIGSTHSTVFVYNLLIKSSFEERLLGIVTKKGMLADAIQGRSSIDTLIPVDISLREFLGATI